jgi:hypothetical protein
MVFDVVHCNLVGGCGPQECRQESLIYRLAYLVETQSTFGALEWGDR